MPGYGIAPAEAGDGLLPWSWATDRLDAARSFWLSTVRADGAPHAMPVWAVRIDHRLVLSTGGRSRKARNLAAEPRCVLTVADADEPVVVEGTARRLVDPDEVATAVAAYAEKYGESPPDPDGNPLFEIHANVVFGMSAVGTDFTTTPTRWELDVPPG